MEGSSYESFEKPHQQSINTLIRDLQTIVQPVNGDQKRLSNLWKGIAKHSFSMLNVKL